MKVPMDRCKKRLSVVWFIGGGFVFFILLLQTMFGRFGANAIEAWGWFLPTVMPTLSLMLGVLIADAVSKKATTKSVDRFLFRLAFTLSFVYVLVVALTVLLQPLSAFSNPLELMGLSNLWLGPLQGLVAAVIATFFDKAEPEVAPI